METRRGSMAKLACETCRLRKSKCDERKPKCGSCEKLGAQCRYRDRRSKWRMAEATTDSILNRLKNLEDQLQQERQKSQKLKDDQYTEGMLHENSIGNLSINSSASQRTEDSLFSSSSFQSCSSTSPSVTFIEDAMLKSFERDKTSPQASKPTLGLTHAHSIWLWPCIQEALRDCTPSALEPLRSLKFSEISLLMRLQKPVWEDKSFDNGGGYPTATTSEAGYTTQFNSWTRLSYEKTQRLASTYFNTFGFLYPFMNRQWFFTHTLPKALNGSIQAEDETTITLFVLALGQLAEEGSLSLPISATVQRSSGIRGGTAKLPPGYALFDKARQRVGFTTTQYTLESVQIFCLMGLFFSQCCRHLDFWRCAITASQQCQLLLSKEPVSWSTARGDQIALTYWHCVIMENGLHYELGLPQSGIDNFDEEVPFPTFIGADDDPMDTTGDNFSHYRMQFLSQIALRRVCGTIHHTIHEEREGRAIVETPQNFGVPQPPIIQEFARQIEMWRESLPSAIQWLDESPSEQAPASFTADCSEASTTFCLSSSPSEIIHPVLNARLRSRFYHVTTCIYRPYAYKVLHYPKKCSTDDIEKCVLFLKACCRWPIFMSPANDRMRLLPYQFVWSQTILGILLIFHLTTRHPLLCEIREKYFRNKEIEETTSLMVNWLQDMREIDGVAQWSWEILSQLPNY